MDVLSVIRKRRSVRQYSDQAIPDEVMARMREALRFAPSACNYQPWHFIFVQDPKLREEVAGISKKQDWMAKAPVIVVGLGDADHAYPRMGGYWNSVEVDVAIAFDHLTLAAVEEGLGTCWIGAFDESQIKPVLNIPDHMKIIAMTPLGYPANKSLLQPVSDTLRKPEIEIFSTDRYGGESGQ